MADTEPSNGLLFRYALFGAAIAFAGPPIYIHAPSFYTQVHGMDLAIVGAVLLAVRSVDFVQDPVLGHVIARFPAQRAQLAIVFAGALGLGVLALFAPQTPLAPAAWLALASVIVFTGFSGLQILFYSAGVGLIGSGGGGHARVAAWREAGVLAGVTAAAAAPTLMSTEPRVSYALYAVGFAMLLAAASIGARPVWARARHQPGDAASGFLGLLRDRPLRALFAVGLLNTLPVSLTSTLFLFFVGDRLGAGVHAGPMLLVFFLAAGLAAPAWGRAGRVFGMRRALIAGMALAIVCFSFALTLREGDWAAFYVISALSGAAISADLTLLPALLSARMAGISASSAHAFGLWGFLTKASLALAAGMALPALSLAGYAPGADNGPAALAALSIAYAGVPCVLKVAAIAALASAPLADGER